MMIAIDASRALRARRTGTERYALEIIRHLLALPDAAAYHWRLYVDEAPPSAFFGPPAPHVSVVCLPRQRLWTHRALARALRQAPPGLLFVPAHVVPFAPACLWRGRACPPSVVTIHDLGYHRFPQAHTPFQRLYLPISTWWSAHAAHAVIAVSQATATDLQRLYGVAPATVTVIHEAASPPVAAGVTDAGTDYGLPPRYGLYVGTLQPRKNLPRLLLAYAQLRQRQLVDWPLVLAGAPGHDAAALGALAQRLQIASHVRFLGYVAERDLPALYQGAHLFLFPSLFEGFGLPVLEAQSYGVPVMCANNSSLPEIAGDAALLVDPTDVEALADAMVRLSEDEALRQQLIAAGHENVKRFSWEKAARETLAVFERVLQRNG
jgi:glycosyltransferase involved in cell wall biosynthesis